MTYSSKKSICKSNTKKKRETHPCTSLLYMEKLTFIYLISIIFFTISCLEALIL